MSEGSVFDNTTENENRNIPKGWKAVALFAIFAFAILCTAGVIVGYGQLYPTLIASKVFYNLCNTSNASYSYEPFNHTCEKQDAALGKMFNLAASMNIFVQAFGGVLLDFAGPKMTFLFAMALLIPGTILFAFSSPDFDYYFLSFQLVAAGGPLVFVSVMDSVCFFPQATGLLMAIINGCFGGGALIFLIMNFLFFDYEYSLKTLFLGYATLLGLILLCGLFLWPWSKFSSEITTTATPEDRKTAWKNWFSGIWSHIKTFDFLFLVFYIGVLITKGNFFLSTSTAQLRLSFEGKVDPNVISEYGHILGLMIPVCGLIMSPGGILIDYFGLILPIFFEIVLSSLSAACFYLKIQQVQILRYIIFSIYYPFTYTLWADFLIKKFGYKYYGSLYAIIAITSGLFNFVNTPLLDLPQTYSIYFWINTGWILASLVFLPYCIYYLIIWLTRRSAIGVDEKEPLVQ